MRNKRMLITIPLELKTAIEEEAKRKCISQASVVRMILAKELLKNG